MESDSFKALVLKAIEDQGLSVAEAARRSGVNYDVIRDMKRGQAGTTSAENAIKIAQALGFDWPPTDESSSAVAVAGRVGAGAMVNLEDPFPKGDGHYRIACPPQISPRGIVAVEVVGDSMAPMYQPGDVLFYTRATHEGVPDEDIGRACVVEDATGHAWVKQVKRGDEPGLFHLISLNPASETRHNQRIKWAARVRLALPAEFVVRVE